jgi:SsrA-binding protein
MKDKVVATNRQALYNYSILEKFECGIQLYGPEIKSIRAGRVNLRDSFAIIDKGEMFLHNCHVSPYEHTTAFQLDPKRRRKLLLHKAQIMRLVGRTSQKGLTLVPLKFYLKSGLCKVELALAKGKRLYDKRRAIKDKEARRELKRMSNYKKDRG